MRRFVFQAEDGIRDLVRSRGLGDVYKRQALTEVITLGRTLKKRADDVLAYFDRPGTSNGPTAVSYTHLTLPTGDLV